MWPALIAAGASLLGGVLGNKSSAKEAQKNRDFQEDLSNTSYQRQVADLRAAGINPMLSAKLGGASTPSGSQASQSDVITPAVNSGMAAHRTSAEVDNLRRQNELISAQTADANASAAQKEAGSRLIDEQIIALRNSYPKITADIEQSTASAGHLRAQTAVSNAMVNKVVAETANIKNDNERIKAATAKILAESEKLGHDSALVRASIVKAYTEILNIDAKTAREKLGYVADEIRARKEAYGLPKARREMDMYEGQWGEYSPYLNDLSSLFNSAGKAKSLLGR